MTSVERVMPGHRGLEAADAFDVLVLRIAANHPLQDAVAPRLHGQVDVAREHLELGVGAHQRRHQVARVRARVTEARELGHVARDPAKERRELALVRIRLVGVGRRREVARGIACSC